MLVQSIDHDLGLGNHLGKMFLVQEGASLESELTRLTHVLGSLKTKKSKHSLDTELKVKQVMGLTKGILKKVESIKSCHDCAGGACKKGSKGKKKKEESDSDEEE